MADQPLLIDGLTLQDRMYLAHLTNQPGFKVVVDLMHAACAKANEDVIKLNPEDPNIKDYEKALISRQQNARSINQFCTSFLKSVEFHRSAGVAEEQARELEEALHRHNQ